LVSNALTADVLEGVASAPAQLAALGLQALKGDVALRRLNMAPGGGRVAPWGLSCQARANFLVDMDTSLAVIVDRGSMSTYPGNFRILLAR